MLLKAGYRRGPSAGTRKAQSWEERADAELAGRSSHTAVWTGTDMIVFGGEGMGVIFDEGARYNPETDTLSPISTIGAPKGRTLATAVWTGTEMLVWAASTTPSRAGRAIPAASPASALATIRPPMPGPQ